MLDDDGRQRLGFWQLMAIGTGQRPRPELIAALRPLSRIDRLRVGHRARNGRVAWDVDSAWAILAIRDGSRRSTRAVPLRTVHTISLGFVVLAAVMVGIAISQGDVITAVFMALCGTYFGVIGVRRKSWRSGIERSATLSEPLVAGTEPPPTDEISGATVRLGIALAFVSWSVWIFAIDITFSNTTMSTRSAVVQSVVTAAIIVPLLRFQAQRRERKADLATGR
jgi:hypothetical protein